MRLRILCPELGPECLGHAGVRLDAALRVEDAGVRLKDEPVP